MLPTPAPETPVIDRSACPSRGGHGTRWQRREHGCRCPDALADQRRAWYGLAPGDPIPELYVPVVGLSRRLQAAAVRGWSAQHIGDRAGMAQQHVSRLRGPVVDKVSATIAARLVRVVDELHALPEPVDPPGKGAAHSRARGHAARRGWHPLDAWVDIDDPTDVPDALFARTDTQLVATADLLELAMHMRVDGRPDHDAIARRVGMSADAVQRRLERRGRGPSRLTADQVYAIRDEYLRTRGDGWNGKATAKRYGVSTFVVSTIIHGTTRPELGLTDLTVQQGGHTPAATPTGGSNRKGSAA